MSGNPSGYPEGSREFRRALVALFTIGLATFALLWCLQPLLPLLGRDFGRGPAAASLALAVSTLGLAVAVIPMARMSDRWGRTKVIRWSLLAAAAFGLLTALAPNWPILLVARALQGAALAGIPATAMAWVTEEIHPRAIARAGGLYIAGNSVGGMSGRLIGGVLAEWWGWSGAVLGITILALAATVVGLKLLPPPRSGRTTDRRASPAKVEELGVRTRRLVLYGIGAAAMAAFVGLYNVLGYRLETAPFLLSPAVTGLIFLAYLAGTVSSARAGRLSARFGLPGAIRIGLLFALAGVALTLFDSLVLIVVGVVAVTAGFFTAHSLATSSAPRGARRPSGAAAGYVLAYYAGSSAGGPLLGGAWSNWAWPGTAAVAGLLLCLAILLSWSRPLQEPA